MKLVLRKDVRDALSAAGWNCRYARNGKSTQGGANPVWMYVTLVGHDPCGDGYNDVVRIVKGVSPEVEMVVAEYTGWDLTSNAKSVVPPQVEHFEQAELFKT